MVDCWETMILIINAIMDTAPEFNKTGLVGFPINVILNWPMATPAGFAAFLNDKVGTSIRCSQSPIVSAASYELVKLAFK